MKNKLYLVEIDPEYCRYLWKSDNRVMDSFSPNKISRKYLGVLLKVKDMEYFAPLTSKPNHMNKEQKEIYIQKHLTDPSLELVFINNKKTKLFSLVSQINLNNMIPVKKEEYNIVEINKLAITDYKLANFLRLELKYINSKKEKIIKKANNIYKSKINNKLNYKLDHVTCDFKLLEKMCEEYNQIKVSIYSSK